jgi:hypothetical protein
MRSIGLIGLLLALIVVGVLVKKQLNVVTAPVLPPGVAAAGAAPTGDVHAQSQQLQQQIKQSIEAAQKPRALPDDN